MNIIYIIQEQQIYLRLFLPAIPALALFWGYGYDRLRRYHKYLMPILIITLCMFSAAEIYKAHIAANTYTQYQDDFTWIKEHTAPNATIYPYAHNLVYATDRMASTTIEDAQVYISSPLTYKEEQPSAEALSMFTKVYEDKKTDVVVYTNS